MLETKTLRIGNIVIYKDGRLCKIEGIPHGVAINVTGVNNYDISGSFNPNHFERVEITPEILIELGFEYEEWGNKFSIKNDDYFVFIRKYSTVDYYWKYIDDESVSRNIKFVDELQNLVFFLKNIELEFKPKNE